MENNIKGLVLRKFVHMLLALLLSLPLYIRDIANLLIPAVLPEQINYVLSPGVIYAQLMFWAAIMNAFRVKRPIPESRLKEIRRKARELPIGKRIEEIVDAVEKTINLMMREYEWKAGYFGLVNGTIGVATGYLLVGHHVFYGALAMATTDVYSSLIGSIYGRHKIPFSNGSVEGLLAGFTSYLAVLVLFTNPAKACLLAIAASIVELYGVEDNLSIPVVVSITSKILDVNPPII